MSVPNEFIFRTYNTRRNLPPSTGRRQGEPMNWWPNERRPATGKSNRRGFAWLSCDNASSPAILRHSTPLILGPAPPRRAGCRQAGRPDAPRAKSANYGPPTVLFKPFPPPRPSEKCGTCPAPAGQVCHLHSAISKGHCTLPPEVYAAGTDDG